MSHIGRGVLLRFRAPARRDDDGAALVLVVGSMLVLAMLALTALAYAIGSQRFARYTQDYTSGMAAAQSGIEHYISQLNRNDRYGDEIDCSNPALKGPMPPSTNSCGYTMSTEPGWAPVDPANTAPEAPHFHYSVDASRSRSEGTIVLTVTGRVNGEYRTVEAVVGKGGSTDFVYYTDFESADPANVEAYPNGPSDDRCGRGGYENAQYWWEGRRYARCQEITFISADVLDGGVFTNDSALSSGAHFQGGFFTANPNCKNATSNQTTWRQCLRQDGKNSTANFHNIRPAYSDPLYLDDTSAAFKDHPGCHYFGSTRIVFNANGTMTVWNKTSVNGNRAPVAEAATGLPTPQCGTLEQLDSNAGATVPVPNEMVIYVANSNTSDRQCDSGELGGPSGRTLPLGTYDRDRHKATNPTSTSYTYDVTMRNENKRCGRGNLYVEGTLNGRVTLASEQSIILVGDLVLEGGRFGNDMVGLVATDTVEVFHPIMQQWTWDNWWSDCSTTSTWSAKRWCPVGGQSEVSGWPRRYLDPTTGGYYPTKGIQIAGSIQTLQHSFLVQQYATGAHQGTLYVYGSIAQRWRGIVGQSGSGGGHGYDKLYQYDRRLITSAPPYFPRWINAQWSLRYSGEIATPPELRT